MGSQSSFDEGLLNYVIYVDLHESTRKLGDIINCAQSTLMQHLHSVGKMLQYEHLHPPDAKLISFRRKC